MSNKKEGNYHFKNRVTHENDNYAKKISFFADCFEFTILNLGSIGAHPLENHRSLLAKIRFQLDNYTTYSKKYIVHYFKNSYLQSKDEVIEKYYSHEYKLLRTAKGKCEKNGNYSDENSRVELISSIDQLLAAMENTLFTNSLDRVIRAILCEYPLEGKHDHVKIFEYYTPILVTEIAFAGFNLKDLRDIIRIISEKEITIEYETVNTKAILPSDLLELKGKTEDFFNAASEYLKNRNLKQQLEGIYLLLKNNIRSRTLLFQIGSVRAFEPFTFEYLGVKFFNKVTEQYDFAKERYKSFFPEAQAFAEVTVLAGDEFTALIMAERKINDALNYFNAVFQINARLDVFRYILQDNEKQTLAVKYAGVIHRSDSHRFDDAKIETYLKGVDNQLARKAILLDMIYFQALGAGRSEDKLLHFWRYLESFFDYDGYNAEEVIEKVSMIVGNDSVTSYIFFVHNLAWYILTGTPSRNGHEYFHISEQELSDHLKSKPIDQVNFNRLNEIIRHPYVSRQISWFLETSDHDKISNGTSFYSNVLFETYEQRNLLEHSGLFYDKSVQKLVQPLEKLTHKFRSIITREIKTGAYKNFKDLIDHLYK